MGTGSHVEMKEFEKMLDARIARAHARMQQLEARAHEKKMQPEIAALEAARNLMRHIDQKRHSLEEASGHRLEEVQSEIEAANARLDTSIDKLTSKLQAEARGGAPTESHARSSGELHGKESHPKQHAKPHIKPCRPSDKPH
jgi:DNA repair exonuclease SbcCD ATPase subunit